jgi:hypothetical protein
MAKTAGCGGGWRDEVFHVGQTDPATESRRTAGWKCPPGEAAKKGTSYREGKEVLAEQARDYQANITR